jgi:cob(I)alamin adenosyltransferase
MEAEGYVHVYTGDGKGKTTAALGLVLRAIGAGWDVFVAQFAKGTASSELVALQRLGRQVQVRQFGDAHFIDPEPETQDVLNAQQGWNECREAVRSGRYRLVILDEANVAVALGLLNLDDVIEMIEEKPRCVELVLTGRYAHRRIIELADLVTEMQEVKHYFQRGIPARTGVER